MVICVWLLILVLSCVKVCGTLTSLEVDPWTHWHPLWALQQTTLLFLGFTKGFTCHMQCILFETSSILFAINHVTVWRCPFESWSRIPYGKCRHDTIKHCAVMDVTSGFMCHVIRIYLGATAILWSLVLCWLYFSFHCVHVSTPGAYSLSNLLC